MAMKQFYATGDFRYRTRMLRAGDGPFPMDGPTARVFTALKKISPEAPATAAPPTATVPTAKPKRAPRKRAAKKAQ